MKRSHLRTYILISVLLHLLLLWLILQLPPYEITQFPPVTIRVLDPVPLASLTSKQMLIPKSAKPKPHPIQPNRQGGILTELPKSQQEARPDNTRLISRYDSRAQDIGPGNSGTHKPSGQNPSQLPPELALPERYGKAQPNQPNTTEPLTSLPPTSRQPKAMIATTRTPSQPQSQHRQFQGNQPIPPTQKNREQFKLKPPKRQFRISSEQEVALLQREPNVFTKSLPKTIRDQTTPLDHSLPLPTFDAPSIYQQGPEQTGESNQDTGHGAKFRSVDAYGLKHFSYLIGIQRKIELVFSVPSSPPQYRIGVPIVGFTIQRNGQLSEAILLRSSGHSTVDRALLEAVKRAAPYRPFPKYLPDREISIRVYATIS